MNATTKPESGDTYWQTDIQTPRGIVRCVVYLFAGAVEKELKDTTSNISMHQKAIGHPVPDEHKEKCLAALCAIELAASGQPGVQFSELPPMIQIDGLPEGKEKYRARQTSESWEGWVWWQSEGRE